MPKTMPKYVALFFGSMFILCACDTSVVFQKQQAIPGEGWHFRDSIAFEVHIEDTTSLHKMYVDVRNATDYGYSNLFLFLDIRFPDGTTLRDTLECTLADRRGNWEGSGVGNLRFNRFLFRDDVWFPEQGTYHFILYQGMREDVLPGIADVGLRIERKY